MPTFGTFSGRAEGEVTLRFSASDIIVTLSPEFFSPLTVLSSGLRMRNIVDDKGEH